MEYYKIRIDIKESIDRSDILGMFDKYFTTYLIAFEGTETENPHCHGYIETETKQATIRLNIRKRFGGGNGSYSLKALDEQFPLEYLAYMIKDGEFINHGVPEAVLVKAKEHDIKVKKEMKEKKLARRTVLQQIDEAYFSQVENGLNKEIDMFVSEEFVVSKVLEFYKEKDQLVRQFMIVSLCQTLCIRYVNGYQQRFQDKILEML